MKKIKSFNDYNHMRDFLYYNTTNMSAYLNFGCISIREFYHYIIKYLGYNNNIIK
jgi:deoxyribodipyrimidine photolyase